jgi:hypothetical protein
MAANPAVNVVVKIFVVDSPTTELGDATKDDMYLIEWTLAAEIFQDPSDGGFAARSASKRQEILSPRGARRSR